MKLLVFVLSALFALSVPSAHAQDERVYDEGPVVEVSYIRVKPGQWDAYMKYLATTYRGVMEEQKKAGLITDWGAYSAYPRAPSEANLILTTVYPNMAALDGYEDKAEPVMRKFWTSRRASAEASVDRESMREVLGGELVREITFR